MPKAPPKVSAIKIKRKAWQGYTAGKRTTGRKLQRARQQLFRDDPLCAECRAHGQVTIATIRDHIIPLAFGGADDESNAQGLCEPCHNAKTRAEAAEGRKRTR